jgi:hypothetical protein
MKEWDIFVSHASEDKESVALPLRDRLKKAGLNVWLDRFELKIGDSLREKIDEGLARSRYGVIVLSPSFLAKRWPTQELNGLFAREEAGRKLILPVWHNITKESLAQASPMLADRLAANTALGIDAVASAIVDVVVNDQESPTVLRPTPARLMTKLLESDPEPSAIRDFLSLHPSIITSALGIATRNQVRHSVILGNASIDLCVAEHQPTRGSWFWRLVVLHPLALTGFGLGLDVPRSLKTAVEKLSQARMWVAENPSSASARLPDLRSDFAGVVFAGRRAALSDDEKSALGDFNDLQVGIRVHTYDRLIEAAIL